MILHAGIVIAAVVLFLIIARCVLRGIGIAITLIFTSAALWALYVLSKNIHLAAI